jgi:hypothetical protein
VNYFLNNRTLELSFSIGDAKVVDAHVPPVVKGVNDDTYTDLAIGKWEGMEGTELRLLLLI